MKSKMAAIKQAVKHVALSVELIIPCNAFIYRTQTL